ncbi:trichohyalin-like [Macrobrachium rosenbergii]|uniref:trichohyalin-like n=1 Tax=Macrobrachium rosenbergii TaxID=79674 RepID=UPI0034D78C94
MNVSYSKTKASFSYTKEAQKKMVNDYCKHYCCDHMFGSTRVENLNIYITKSPGCTCKDPSTKNVWKTIRSSRGLMTKEERPRIIPEDGKDPLVKAFGKRQRRRRRNDRLMRKLLRQRGLYNSNDPLHQEFMQHLDLHLGELANRSQPREMRQLFHEVNECWCQKEHHTSPFELTERTLMSDDDRTPPRYRYKMTNNQMTREYEKLRKERELHKKKENILLQELEKFEMIKHEHLNLVEETNRRLEQMAKDEKKNKRMKELLRKEKNELNNELDRFLILVKDHQKKIKEERALLDADREAMEMDRKALQKERENFLQEKSAFEREKELLERHKEAINTRRRHKHRKHRQTNSSQRTEKDKLQAENKRKDSKRKKKISRSKKQPSGMAPHRYLKNLSDG